MKPGIGSTAVPSSPTAACGNRIMRNRGIQNPPDTLFGGYGNVRQNTSPRSVIPYASRKSSCVHTQKTRNVFFFKKLPQGTGGTEVGRILAKIPYNQCPGRDKPAFIVLVRQPVIPNQRVSHYYCLIRVGGIGENLLVAGAGSVEYDLAHSILPAAKSHSGIYAPVFQY